MCEMLHKNIVDVCVWLCLVPEMNAIYVPAYFQHAEVLIPTLIHY